MVFYCLLCAEREFGGQPRVALDLSFRESPSVQLPGFADIAHQATASATR